MKKVYICSPLRGNMTANIQKARDFCEYTLNECGAIPIAPHIYFTQFLDDTVPAEREMGIKAGMELLHGCDEIWVFGDRISEGMDAEIKLAKAEGIKVKYVDERVLAMNQPIQHGGMGYV